MMPDKLADEIEDLFLKRDMLAAKSRLPKLVALCRKHHRLLARTADFLLRLPDPAQAFRLLCDHDLDHEPRLLLANAANFLGASGYALRILETVPEPVKVKRRIETGQILSTTYHDVDALRYFSNLGTPQKPKPGLGEVGERAMLFRCYALLELGQLEEVLAISNYFLQPHQPIGRKAFALIFTAWAYLELDEVKAASQHLTKFENLPGRGDMWPHALYHQVAGMMALKRDNPKKATKHLARAWKMTFKPGLQPEATWLPVLYLKGKARFADGGRLPDEWVRLLLYPSVTSVYRQRISQVTPIPDLIVDARSRLSAAHELHIDADGGFVRTQGKIKLHVSLPLRALSLLICGGPYGVPLFRMLDALWPAEPLSLKTHVKRLEQIIIQLRCEGFHILWSRNHLWLEKTKLASVEKNVNKSSVLTSAAIFWRPGSVFTRRDIQNFSNISERQAKRVCQNWLQQNRIQRQGAGRSTKYRVTDEE